MPTFFRAILVTGLSLLAEAGLMAATVLVVRWRQRRRSPLTEDLLRLPSRSFCQRLNELQDDLQFALRAIALIHLLVVFAHCGQYQLELVVNLGAEPLSTVLGLDPVGNAELVPAKAGS